MPTLRLQPCQQSESRQVGRIPSRYNNYEDWLCYLIKQPLKICRNYFSDNTGSERTFYFLPLDGTGSDTINGSFKLLN